MEGRKKKQTSTCSPSLHPPHNVPVFPLRPHIPLDKIVTHSSPKILTHVNHQLHVHTELSSLSTLGIGTDLDNYSEHKSK